MNRSFLKLTGITAILCIGAMSSGALSAQSVTGCNAPSQIPEGGITVPMYEGINKHRLIDVKVNNSLQRAVIDTGGMGVGGVVNQKAMQGLNIDPQSGHQELSNGAHAQSMAKMFNMAQTDIAGAKVSNLKFMGKQGNIIKDQAVTTLIGAGYLCQFLLSIDFADNSLSLNDRNTPITSLLGQQQWVELPFENFQGAGGVIFEVEVNGRKVKAALDTGSPYNLLDTIAAKTVGIDLNSDKISYKQIKSKSLHGKVNHQVATTDLNFSVDGGKLNRTMDTRIKDIHAIKQLFGDDGGMIFGLPFFEGRKLIIDYQNSKLYISA